MKPRCGGHFSCVCNEQCHKHLPSLSTPFRWDPSAYCHGGLHSWIFHQQQRRGVSQQIIDIPTYLRCIWVATRLTGCSCSSTLPPLTTSAQSAGSDLTTWWSWSTFLSASFSSQTSQCSSLLWLQPIGLLHSGKHCFFILGNIASIYDISYVHFVLLSGKQPRLWS